jgi:hypothetical protein
MGKSSIELTLKQLIDLGIINLKKRKRKRKGKRVKKYIVDGIRSDSSGMQGYSTQLTDASKSFNPNSDALRLRDAQEELRIKQLQQIETNKNFESDARRAILDLYNRRYETSNEPIIEEPEDIPRQQRGFAEDDGVGIMGKSATDEQFVPQINRQEQQPQLIPQQQAQVRFADIDEEPFGLAPEQLQPVVEIKSVKVPKNLRQPKKQKEEEPVAKQAGGELPKPVLRNVQGFAMPEVILQQPPKASPRSILKGRPSKEDILYYQSWYESLTGENADEKILNSVKKSEIENEIVKILLSQYKAVGGANKQILKSKKAEVIQDEINLLKGIFKS